MKDKFIKRPILDGPVTRKLREKEKKEIRTAKVFLLQRYQFFLNKRFGTEDTNLFLKKVFRELRNI